MKRALRIDGDLAFVPLTRGVEAIIDAADAHVAEPYNWCAQRVGGRLYAVRRALTETIILHRAILQARDGDRVTFKDGQSLDCRRSNLALTPAGDVQPAEIEGEEWRPVVNGPNYEVSNFGRVRNVKRGKILTPVDAGKGYLRVSLYGNHGGGARLIHGLVLGAFVGPRPPGHHGAHMDNDRGNNRLSNLMYATVSENALHKRGHGTMAAGERNGCSKLTDDIVRAMRAEYRRGDPAASLAALARKYGVWPTTISMIVRGRSWAHVGTKATSA